MASRPSGRGRLMRGECIVDALHLFRGGCCPVYSSNVHSWKMIIQIKTTQQAHHCGSSKACRVSFTVHNCERAPPDLLHQARTGTIRKSGRPPPPPPPKKNEKSHKRKQVNAETASKRRANDAIQCNGKQGIRATITATLRET